MFRVESVEPERWSEADWVRSYALHCSANQEQGSHARPLAAYRMSHVTPPGGRPRLHWVARDGEAIVGKLDLTLTAAAPDLAVIGLFVMSEARRRGVGSALLREALGVAQESGALDVHGSVARPANWAICERLGGRFELAMAQRVLSLEDANWRLAQQWCAAAALRSASTQIVQFERVPDEFAATLLELNRHARAEVPRSWSHGSDAPSLALRREQERRHQLLGWRWLTLATLEADGTLSGLTDVTYDPSQPDLVRQNLTVVLPAYRGRGLAKWLKAAMLATMNQQFPAAKRLVTLNANANAPMLAINHELGFGEAAHHRIYEFDLAALRARLCR